MAIPELYGKCKELGYCDCQGFFGCVDVEGANLKPADPNKLHRISHDPMASENLIQKYAANMKDDWSTVSSLVECEVCDRSHAPSHPHIANIDGDVPIDDADVPAEAERAETPRVLPDWLKDSPAKAERPSKPRPSNCPDCGRIARSNHRCKGPKAVPAPPADSRVATELPAPVSVAQAPREPDSEFVAIGAILDALEGFHDERGTRILTYVLDRTGITIP